MPRPFDSTETLEPGTKIDRRLAPLEVVEDGGDWLRVVVNGSEYLFTKGELAGAEVLDG